MQVENVQAGPTLKVTVTLADLRDLVKTRLLEEGHHALPSESTMQVAVFGTVQTTHWDKGELRNPDRIEITL